MRYQPSGSGLLCIERDAGDRGQGTLQPREVHRGGADGITGRPDPSHISTSFVECQNSSVRTSMRRYTRLSNGFSRKIQNHMAAVVINYFAYNFLKIHRSLRMSPAMAAGVVDRLMNDLVTLLIESESKNAA